MNKIGKPIVANESFLNVLLQSLVVFKWSFVVIVRPPYWPYWLFATKNEMHRGLSLYCHICHIVQTIFKIFIESPERDK